MNKDWDLTDYYGEQKDLTRYRAGEPLPNNEPTCIAPWTTITLAANGVIKPCCVYVEKMSISQRRYFRNCLATTRKTA